MAQTGMVGGGRLTDWISLGVLTSWVPADAVDDAVEATGRKAQRRGGKLPPRVTAYLVMAMALFADEDYEEVAARLAGTLADWGGWQESWDRAPTSGGITQARQRLGAEPMAELFRQVARPVADLDTGGAFLGPWRLMSIDGMEWDVPDTAANRAAFGRHEAGGEAAYPKARVVTVSECASHAPVLAAVGAAGGGKGSGEQSLARGLYPALEEDWLLIADRNFFNWDAWRAAAGTGAALLWRVKSDLRLPVLELLPDGSYRSADLAAGHPEAAGNPDRGRPARRGPGPGPGQARPGHRVRRAGPGRRREERSGRPGHHYHRPAPGPGGGPGRGLPPAVG
ncbi:MAG: IS4 family transposase, partial [Trebonia sp.]